MINATGRLTDFRYYTSIPRRVIASIYFLKLLSSIPRPVNKHMEPIFQEIVSLQLGKRSASRRHDVYNLPLKAVTEYE